MGRLQSNKGKQRFFKPFASADSGRVPAIDLRKLILHLYKIPVTCLGLDANIGRIPTGIGSGEGHKELRWH
jgi:hypothetical protein